MSGTIATGSSPGADSAAKTTSVSSWALVAYASHQARWKAQPENGVAHGVRAASWSHVARGMSLMERRSTRKRSGAELSVGGLVSIDAGQAGAVEVADGVTTARIHRTRGRWLREQP